MNRNRHRLVFSRSRDMLVAVAETAWGGKAQQVMACLPEVALMLVGVWPAWSAAQIVPGGEQAPSVVQTRNGLPQVDINRPSGAGVSINTYGQFDVQSRGAILNNSPGLVQTQQAGMINGNPNLGAGQAARVIVNQVNSSAASQINGHVEVAGQRAEVVIANGSGISVNGGGFINTSRAILTTGTPNYAADGSLAGFDVRGGSIDVQGAGLDASASDQIDLLSRVMHANAAIHAKNLNVIAGANRIGHEALDTTAIAGEGLTPYISIDVSQIGGMYANSIVLVGTEAGVGVSSKGVLAAQAGDFTVTAEGKLILTGQTNASGDITLSASGGIDNSGTTYAQRNVIANTSGTLTNGGVLAAQQDTTVNAGSVASTGTLGAGVNGDGSLARSGDLSVTAGGVLAATGRNAAGGNAVLTGVSVDLARSRTSANDALALSATGAGLNLSGATVTAGAALDARASGTLTNDGGVVSSGGAQTVTVGALSNRDGQIVSGGALDVAATGDLQNQSGTLRSSGALSVNVGSLDNTGGTIATNGALDVRSGAVSNRGGTLAAGGAATVQSAGTLDNRAGLIQGGGAVSVSAQGAIDNMGGQIEADGADTTLQVTGASLDNTNGRIANSGSGATTVSAATLVNSNAGDVAGAGTIGGNGDLTVNADTLSNTNGGQIVSGRDLTLDIAQLADNTNATLSGSNNVTLNGAHAGVVNAGGSIHGNGAIALNVGSLDNTSGRIGNDTGSGGSVSVNADTLANQNGAIGSDQNLSVVTNLLTGDGRIIAGQDGVVTVNGDYTLTGRNQIQANHDLTFTTAGTFTNLGTLGAVNALTVDAASVDNLAGANLNSSTTTVNAANAINNEGRIEGDIVATTSGSLVNTAAITGNMVTLNAGSIGNRGAAAVMAAASQLNLYSRGDISNTGGANLFSLGDIHIAADGARDVNGLLANRSNSVINDQSTIEAQGNVEVATHRLTNTRPAPTVETVTTRVETEHRTKRSKYLTCTTTGADKGYCTQAMWDSGYLAPLDTTFSGADVVSQRFGPDATDKLLVVNIDGQPTTIYYDSLTTNTDGSITVSYWDGYDPTVNYDPGTEYASRNDAHKGYQRVEIARDTTTTTQQDRVTGPQAQQAQIMAGGNIVFANVGTLDNEYSAIGAGGSIQIGSADAQGDVTSGKYGGTLVNNIGQTLYQYQKQDIVSTYAWNENVARDVGTVVEPSMVLSPVAIGGTGGTIVANNSMQISATDIANTNVAAANSATGATGGTLGANGSVGGITGTGAQTVDLATGEIQNVDALQSIAGPGGALSITLPSSGLYTFNTAPGASYLVVTDPRLTRYTSFISSDYMLAALGVDPLKTIKRLGDGVYEERMVRDQITQLTGRVYLQGYTSNEDEYRALMSNGVNVAKAFNLEPGLALTAAQMDALTSDIVWLVSQTVTLPDGSTQEVLAPVVYLAQIHANDLRPTGALIAADDVQIHASGSATNSGVIKGGTQTVIAATDILNRGGAIGSSADSGTTLVSATNDVVNASGRISGNRVAVLAGHDVLNTTLVDTVGVGSVAGNSMVGQSLLGAQGTIASTGDLVVVAGNDLAVHGASIAARGNAQIAAGHDMTVDTVQSATLQSVANNDQHHWETSTTLNQTSGISAGGDLAMQSGNDTTLKGATVVAGSDMAVVAGGNLTATTATNTATYNNVAMDDKARKQADRSYDEQAVGTNISAGGNATLAALSDDPVKGHVTLTGSSLAAGRGAAAIAASGDVVISEGREEHDSYSATQSQRGSFVHGSTIDTMQSTQANIGVGSTVSGDTVTVSAGRDLSVKGSTVAGTNDVKLAAGGNVAITTSQDTQSTASYYQKHESGFGTGGGIGISVGSRTQTDTAHDATVMNAGSTVGSLDGSLNITAGKDLHVTGSDLVAAQNVTGTGANVTIDSAVDTMHHDDSHEVKQSGFTLAIKAPVIDAVSNTVDQAHAASHRRDDRAAALHGMAAASSAIDSVGAARAALDSLANGQAPSAKIELSYGSSHSKNTYAEDSTTHRGSRTTSGGTAAFVAAGDDTQGSGNLTIAGSNVNANDVILAAKNRVDLVNTTDTDSTRSSNESSSASVGISYGTQGFGVDASMSRAHGNGISDTAMQNNTYVTAANTATIISGGDTNIIGSKVNGRRVNADVGGDLSIESVQDTMSSSAHQESTGGGFAISQGGGSASFSHTSANASGSYAGVNEQAGIRAGDGGFNINVEGNTALKGAVIASDADASKTTLSTSTLTYGDMQNSSSYNAHTGGIGGGVTTGDGGANYSTHGSGSTANGPNAGGPAPMLSQNDSGSDSVRTRSGVSAGTIIITDADHQTQDVASLNRDTSKTNGTVATLPDVNNLLERQSDMMAAAGAAGEAVSRRIGDSADVQATATGDPEWAAGGKYRAAMQAAGAALVTGLAGGNAIGGAAGGGSASIAAGKLNVLSGAIANSDPTGNANMNTALGNIVANAIATGAAAAVGGDAGAFSGYNVDRYNRQLHPEEKTLAKQIEDKSGGQYTQAQVEDQLRIMGVTVNGANESGAPTTLIGQVPTDSSAQWISGGTAADGKPILTQVTAQADPQLQSYILENYNSASPGGVPSQFSYQQTRSGSINITGPFTKFDKSDADFMRNTSADTASMVSNTAGWISSAAATGAVSPSPLAPAFGEIAFGATVVGIAADGVSQLVRPNVGQYTYQGAVALAGQIAADRAPTASLVVNGVATTLNNAPYSTQIQDWITRQSNSIFNVNSNGTRK
ncbi:hemagglutinin repeat-containing protein [Paraburkholderia sp. BCC1886]|uniref:hemagglutinin repeat-containing protein n=1 Tax=Paraburkholderia sp. BCC1886 TaxID=2562670 RepID=UPI0011833758|nr:hemagglutinin repeat-containing protein [Paraburkholderia sp. BCC1886]